MVLVHDADLVTIDELRHDTVSERLNDRRTVLHVLVVVRNS